MKHGFHAFLIVTFAIAVSALPVIEIRTTDTDGGPTTRLKLLALPILREIAVPDATIYYMTSQYNHGCTPVSQQNVENNTTTEGAIPDNAAVPKLEDNPKANEIPSVTFYV